MTYTKEQMLDAIREDMKRVSSYIKDDTNPRMLTLFAKQWKTLAYIATAIDNGFVSDYDVDVFDIKSVFILTIGGMNASGNSDDVKIWYYMQSLIYKMRGINP